MAKKLGGYAAMEAARLARIKLAKKGKIPGGHKNPPRRTH